MAISEINQVVDNKKNQNLIINNEYIGIQKFEKIYNIYIYEEIDKQYNYLQLFDILNMATKDQKINIYINSCGGYINTTIFIINLIHKCKAEVTTILNGDAYSAGSIIFLAGHKKKVMPNSSLMVHYYSGSIGGKGNEIVSQAEYEKKNYAKIFRQIYKGFLTNVEIAEMLNGKDLWMDSKEVIKRLK